MRAAIFAVIFSTPTVSPGATHPISDVAWQAPPVDSLSARMRRDVFSEGDSTDYVNARTDTRVSWRLWRYDSDSTAVVALVAEPRVTHKTTRQPGTIVFCRGSFVQTGALAVLVPRLHRLAMAGYTVIAPQYRGSEGGDGRDEMGGSDVEDVMAAIRLAHRKGGPVFLYGESRGGMMVLQALRDGADVRAAATVGAFTDLDSVVALSPQMEQMAEAVWPEWKTRHDEIASRRSAMRWAEKIRAPLLILHGADDHQIPVRQSEWLDRRLTALGREHRLTVVPGAGHTLSPRSAWRDSTVLEWFGSHLK